MRTSTLKKTLTFRLISGWIIFSFIASAVTPPSAYAQSLNLPAPGTMVMTTSAFMPVMIKGVQVHPDNPLLFDFILDTGKSGLKIDSLEFKTESQKLIKYFLASLTIKEDDLWVNLSPYEKDRMITEELGKTELGRDMLAQDYILKQLTASMIYPEKDLGKVFWDRVYTKAQQQFGTTDIPVDTFNKVWIVADKAKVLERNNAAYVVGSHLKVMLEEDYVALGKQTAVTEKNEVADNKAHAVASQVIREVIIPEIEKEVNQGQNFAPLRQMFYSMILASWYKIALKDALLNQVYSNRGKTAGVLSDDPAVKEKIYQQYLQAYKKGVFNYIKEDMDAVSKQPMPRKYFSGGEKMRLRLGENLTIAHEQSRDDAPLKDGDMAMASVKVGKAGIPTVEEGLPWETKDYLDILQKTGAAGEEVHFVARSGEMVKVVRQIKQAATNPLRTPVIVYGLTGTGKELTWKIIHYLSPRSGKQPIVLDVNQLNLYEAGDLNRVIFGTKDQPGLLEQGQDSTVVLDGIEDASPGLQGLLLRALESSRMVRADGSAPINLSNVQFVATRNKDFPKGYRQDLVNRFRSQIDLPSLDQREDDRVLLYDFYNQAIAQKLGQTWRPLSLEAGLLLVTVRSKDEKQVRGVQEIIERVLTTGSQNRPYITASDLVKAGLPTNALAVSSSDIPVDVNGIPVALNGWPQWNATEGTKSKGFTPNPYLSIVHGERAYYDLIANPDRMPVQAQRIDRPVAEKIIRGLNGWFSVPANLEKLGVKNVVVKGEKKSLKLVKLTVSLGKQLPNGEYVVEVQFGLEGGKTVQGSIVTGFPKGTSSLWVALLSWITRRTIEGHFGANASDSEFSSTKQFILDSFNLDFGFNKRGYKEGEEDKFIGTYLDFYGYDVTKGFLKSFEKIKSEIPDAAMTGDKAPKLFQFSNPVRQINEMDKWLDGVVKHDISYVGFSKAGGDADGKLVLATTDDGVIERVRIGNHNGSLVFHQSLQSIPMNTVYSIVTELGENGLTVTPQGKPSLPSLNLSGIKLSTLKRMAISDKTVMSGGPATGFAGYPDITLWLDVPSSEINRLNWQLEDFYRKYDIRVKLLFKSDAAMLITGGAGVSGSGESDLPAVEKQDIATENDRIALNEVAVAEKRYPVGTIITAKVYTGSEKFRIATGIVVNYTRSGGSYWVVIKELGNGEVSSALVENIQGKVTQALDQKQLVVLERTLNEYFHSTDGHEVVLMQYSRQGNTYNFYAVSVQFVDGEAASQDPLSVTKIDPAKVQDAGLAQMLRLRIPSHDDREGGTVVPWLLTVRVNLAKLTQADDIREFIRTTVDAKLRELMARGAEEGGGTQWSASWEQVFPAQADAAMNGGIDFNAKNMGLDVAKDGKGIEMKFDPAMVAEFQNGNFAGVEGIILRIVPIASPLPILGLETSSVEGALAKG